MSGGQPNQATDYGRRYADIYDTLFPRDLAAGQTVDFLLSLLPSTQGHRARAIELGVGTGRIAIPLAQRSVAVTGIDTSTDLLARAVADARDHGASVELISADMRDWVRPDSADLVYCVCGTISMLATESEQLHLLRNACSSVRPGGRVVIETHNPDRVLRLHETSDTVEYDDDNGIGWTSVLRERQPRWELAARWSREGVERRAHEFSRLTTECDVRRLAEAAGLTHVASYSDWTGAPYQPMTPTYISTFLRIENGRRDHRNPGEEEAWKESS